MCRVLLGLIIGLPLPGGQVASRVVKAVRAILDFVYMAQFPSHTTDMLRQVQESLQRFHFNKAVFLNLGTREGFNLPKLHSMLHYTLSILLFGTTDNYNTEQTECLHIDFTKEAYRSTNRKNEFMQMTTWVERCERVQRHEAHVARQQLGEQPEAHAIVSLGPPRIHYGYLKMPRNPTLKSVSFQRLASEYGANLFQDSLADFIAHVNNPGVSTGMLRNRAHNTLIPFYAVPVFHKFKFTSRRDNDRTGLEIVDSVQVRPAQTNPCGRIIPTRFDTALVAEGQYTTRPNKGKCVHINKEAC
jgi:hypothetical protein